MFVYLGGKQGGKRKNVKNAYGDWSSSSITRDLKVFPFLLMRVVFLIFQQFCLQYNLMMLFSIVRKVEPIFLFICPAPSSLPALNTKGIFRV